MRAVVLGSGSAGNAVVVESGDGRILVDAGFSCKQIELRMAAVGLDPSQLDAILITHEHGDHTKGLDLVSRRYSLPIYLTAGTREGLSLSETSHRRTHLIASGQRVEVSGFAVDPFGLPHDAREPVGFLIEDGAGRRLGLAADLGSRTQLAWGRLRDLDLLILEANHDLEMLRNGPYPWALKQRVAGRHGHLSNREAADGLPELLSDRLRGVALYHLSRTNNLPAVAAATIGEVLDREGSKAEITVCGQNEPTAWLEVS